MLISLLIFGRALRYDEATPPEQATGGGPAPSGNDGETINMAPGDSEPGIDTSGLSEQEAARYKELFQEVATETGTDDADDTVAKSGEAVDSKGKASEPDAELLELAQSYNLTKEQVAGMTLEEVERYGRLFDKTLLARIAPAPSGTETQQQPPPAEKKEPQQQPPAKQPELTELEALFTKEELEELDPSDPLVRNLLGMHKKVQAFEQYFETTRQQAQLNAFRQTVERFDAFLDDLGLKDIYGTAAEHTPEQFEKRKEAFDQYAVLAQATRTAGLPSDLSKPFVRRAAYAAHADVIDQQRRKELSNNLRRQSSQRLGTPSRPRQEAFDGDIEDDPNLHALYHELEAESEEK